MCEPGIGIKLPEQTAATLLATGQNAIRFQPMGKPKMREWIQIKLDHSEDYLQNLPVFAESNRYLIAKQEGENIEQHQKD